MTSIILPIALLVIAVIFAGLSLAIGARHYIRARQQAYYEARTLRLRSAMLRLLSDDEVSLAHLDEVVGEDGKSAESIAWGLLPKVRGGARESLSLWLQGRGAVDRARLRSRRAGAVGRSRAAEHLGASGVAAAAPDIIRLLNDRRLEVRVVAARALGKLGNPDAVPNLLDSLDGRRSVPNSLISMAIIHIGPTAIDELINGLGRRSPRARAVCAELLGIHGAFQAARWLLLLVEHDASTSVRVSSATALGRLGAPQGVQPLLRALAPTEPRSLRAAAARSLGQIGGPEAVASLHLAIMDEADEVADSAAEALSGLGPKGAEVLAVVSEGEGASSLRALDWLTRVELESERIRRRRPTAMNRSRSIR